MNTSTDIHRVGSIVVRTGSVMNGHIWTEFTFIAEGGEYTVTAYSKKPLEIEGASHVNHIASGEPEPA
jgi:hypothetical protein